MTLPDACDSIATALDYAEQHQLADTIALGTERVLVRQRTGAGAESWQVHDIRDELVVPRRARGTIAVHDAASFALACQQRAEGINPVIYADEERLALVAVLNDDISDGPNWRDYRVALTLRPTPEWTAWVGGQGLGEQQRFAERIEDGLPEITRPDGAEMLEIAQTFHAVVGVEFRQVQRLATGQTQFSYVEDVKASAGTKPGTLTIPETFDLAVRPFIGADRYAVTARLRYRVTSGKLQIGYQLVRPEEVQRTAFGEIVQQIYDAMGVDILRGPAPSMVS